MAVVRAARPPQTQPALRPAAGGGRRAPVLGGPARAAAGRRSDRLAVAVSDHDLDHLTYTDEHKSIADIGWWEEHDRNDRRMLFTLHGRSGARRYALIHTDEQNWLMHLTKEQPSD